MVPNAMLEEIVIHGEVEQQVIATAQQITGINLEQAIRTQFTN